MTAAVDALIDLLQRSFDGDDEHSLIGNLHALRPDDWDRLPPGGGRSIRLIVEHAGAAKHAYAEHLFGLAQRSFDDILRSSPLRANPTDTQRLLDWVRKGHATFLAGVYTLSDADLESQSRMHWGGSATAGWIIGLMVQHDCYHAGEINHIRALLQDDDAWPGLRKS